MGLNLAINPHQPGCPQSDRVKQTTKRMSWSAEGVSLTFNFAAASFVKVCAQRDISFTSMGRCTFGSHPLYHSIVDDMCKATHGCSCPTIDFGVAATVVGSSSSSASKSASSFAALAPLALEPYCLSCGNHIKQRCGVMCAKCLAVYCAASCAPHNQCVLCKAGL